MGIVNVIGNSISSIRRKSGGGIPYKSDLQSLFTTREDLTLPNSIVGGGDAAIVGGVAARFTGISNEYITIQNEVITNGFIEFYVNTLTSGANKCYCGGNNTNDFIYALANTTIRVRATLVYKDFVVPSVIGFKKIRIEFVKLTTDLVVKVFVNDVESSSGQQSFGDVAFNLRRVGSIDAIFSFDGYLYKFQTSTQLCYFNGNSYCSNSGLENVNTNVNYFPVTDYTPQSTIDALINGYVDKDGYQIINHSLNTSAVVGYTKMHEGGKMHNLINSFVEFPLIYNILGAEKVINGGFDSGTGWTITAPLIISGGVLSCDGSQGGTIYAINSGVLTASTKYKISFYAAGIVGNVYFGTGNLSIYHKITNGLNEYYTNTVATGSLTPFIQVTVGGSFTSIDNVSVYEVQNIFDRSDTTIHSAASRSSDYYDASNPTRYHISELDITTIDSYMNQAYKERFYQGFKASYCSRDYHNIFMAYANQKTLLDAVRVHKFIGNTCQLVTVDGEQVYVDNLPVWSET